MTTGAADATTGTPDVINGTANGTNQAPDAITGAANEANQASVMVGKPQKIAKNVSFTDFNASNGQNETVFRALLSKMGGNGTVCCDCQTEIVFGGNGDDVA